MSSFIEKGVIIVPSLSQILQELACDQNWTEVLGIGHISFSFCLLKKHFNAKLGLGDMA